MTSRADALIGRALADCVSGNPSSALPLVVDRGLLPRLVDAGRYHRVLNMVHLAIKDFPIADHDLVAALERYYLHQMGHHLRALADLRSLEAVLSEREVPWLLVKGPVLSEVVYERPDLRVYNDLDVVIARPAFSEAIDALEGSGFDLLDRNWDLIRRERRAQLHLSLRLGTVADVHHHLLNRAAVRHSLSLPMRDLFERATSVTVGDVQVRTLDPEDTLLHLCVHAGLSGGDRLLWMKDIEQTLRHQPPDWGEVVHRALSWRAGPLVAVVLRRARSETHVSVPRDVIETLFASRSRAAVSTGVDRVWPVNRSRGRITPSIVWAQVIRDSWWATATALVGRANRRLHKITHRHKNDHREEQDWQHAARDDRSSRPEDETEARTRYLREITDPAHRGDAV